MGNFLILAHLFSNSGFALASEEVHEATLFSLAFPALNAAIFFGFLFWKLKAPIIEFFHARSKQITDVYERAHLRAREAGIKQSHLEERLKGLEKEINKIKKENAELMNHWEQRITREFQARGLKLKTDALLRLEAEKKSIASRFQSEMVDLVVDGAKVTLRENKEAKNKVGQKILEGLNT